MAKFYIEYANGNFGATGLDREDLSTDALKARGLLRLEPSPSPMIDINQTSSDGARIFAVAVSESATASSTQSVSVAFVGTVAELASATAAQSAIKTANVNVTGIQLFVSIGGVLVWGVIDDSQNPNWQIIDDTQTPGWTQLPS